VRFDYSHLSGFEIRTEPSAWEVQGLGRDLVIVYASSRSVEGEVMQYDLLLAGRPSVLLPIAFGSPALFEDSYSYDPREMPANDFDWSKAVGTRFAEAPDFWRLDLVGDHTLGLYANAVDERDGEYLFTLRVRGDGPPLPVARISSRLVTAVRREQSKSSAAQQAEDLGRVAGRADPDPPIP
jgi:hypothetical protein